MDIKKWSKQIPQWVNKYRYPIVILLVGLVLLMIPGRGESEAKVEKNTVEAHQPDMAQQLTQILGQIEGVGKVKIMLTVAAGETILYHSDQDVNSGEGTSSVRRETVIIADSDRNQQPLITQVLPPKYQGAVVVCQGADVPAVKWAIVEAVSKATGLGADQISVLKMK